MTWTITVDPAAPDFGDVDGGKTTKVKVKVTLTNNNVQQAPLPTGAITAYQYGGGGGFGDPLLREPGAVLEDVLDEYVSVDAARDRYGVVITGSLDEWNLAVDEAATNALRAERANGKGA